MVALGTLPTLVRGQADDPGNGIVDPGCGPWDLATTPMPPLPLDDVTVYAFSQTNCHGADSQVRELAPDLVIRGWSRWDREGVNASDYDFDYVSACHAAGIRFLGGTTATVVFADEFPPAQFERIVTRDAAGAIVPHDNIVPGVRGARRGSLANPEYRTYLEHIGRLQIDGGVDGLFFDEVNHGYDGATYDNNEGFDDYHLADFNAYLLARFPPGTDFARRLRMSPDNLLRRDVPAGDLRRNFNYRHYLAAHGWSRDPFATGNPLATEWGRSYDDHPAPGGRTFVSAAEPYRYFGRIARHLKAYARDKYGRDLLITANGIMPNVDFQSIGLWDHNRDGENGTEANYVPVAQGHLDGAVSLQGVFRRFRAQAEVLAPGAPVVVFLDWPTPTLDRYNALPASEREDYWRLYAAEAYANGLFFAFHLRTTTGEPTATALGLMPFLRKYTAFYRSHAALYQHRSPSDLAVAVSQNRIMTAVWQQARPRRLVVHLVNHNYDRGFVPRRDLVLTVPFSLPVRAVTEASPDLDSDRSLAYRESDGSLTINVPSLTAYTSVIVDY